MCGSIYDNPISCKSCSDFFCLNCIEKYAKKNNNNCICGETLRIKEAHKIIRALLDKYSFHCEKFLKGCQEIIPYKNLKNHYENCDYREIRCEHKKCKAKVFYKDYKVHNAICPFQMIKCKFCKKKGMKKDIENHQQTCDQKLLPCNACHKYFMLKVLEKHKEICPEIREHCPRCNINLKRKDLEKHDEIDCIEALFNKTKTETSAQIQDLKRVLTQLEKEVKNQENFFGVKCSYCHKFACEVSRKNCSQCLNPFCIPCSKRNIKHCKSCDSQICTNCFKKNDFCENCVRKGKKNKYDRTASYTHLTLPTKA